MVIPFVGVSVDCALRVSWSFGPVGSAVTRALSSGACACAVVVILCFCVLDSLVTARARFVPRRAFMQPLLILVWQANDVALCERQVASGCQSFFKTQGCDARSVVCTPSFLGAPAVMCKLVEFSGELALSEDGLALLLCPEEGQVKEFDSVVAWRRCVWLDVRGEGGGPSAGCGFCVF